MLFTLVVVLAALCCLARGGSTDTLPNLLISGFAWAENLVFDGFGSLFVSESVKGEMWRIQLCKNGADYCKVLHLSDGLKSVGGMQIPPDGSTIYAGATLEDGTYAVISTPANNKGKSDFTVVSHTKYQPNGMMCDWESNRLFYTFEGHSKGEGCLMGVDLKTGVESVLYKNDMDGADGLWFDKSTNLLYAGLLTSKKVKVFNVTNTPDSANFLAGEFTGLSSALNSKHMLDDLTLFGGEDVPLSQDTVLLGADWLGSQLQQFNLGGDKVQSIPPPAGVDSFFQLTSVRWGKGPGFDPNSVYVTEGGGLTKLQTDRRVIQIKMK